MKILFIGGTGNISEDCAELLLKRGHDIILLTRGRTTVQPSYRAVQADRKNINSMREALRNLNPEIVINFLGYEVGDVEIDYELFNKSVRQYVFVSSATVYAKPPPALPITEGGPFGNPWWDYAEKKRGCEIWLEERWRNEQFPMTIVRPSHTYSKRWLPNPISSSSYTFAARLEQAKPVYIHDDGETPWTLTASSDFAVGLSGLLGNERALGEAFHITSDEVLTWNEIYSQLASALGVRNPAITKIPTDFICHAVPRFVGTLKGDKAHPGIFDNSKIKRLVPEFVCQKRFEDGARQSVEWLRAHPTQQNLSPELDSVIEDVLRAWEEQNQKLKP